MQTIHSSRGHHRDSAGNEEAFRLARDHVTGDHPEMQRRDERIRPRMAAGPCDSGFLA